MSTKSKFAKNKVTWFSALKSEWVKFYSLRSNWITMILTVAAIIGFSILSAVLSHSQGNGPRDRSDFERVLTGANFAVLIISVFGSVMGAREYSSGMIRTSITAIPTRLPVLLNKLTIFFLIVFPAILVSVIIAFFLGMSLFQHYGLPINHWSDPFIARAVIGRAFYIVGLGLLGLSVGIMLRHTAAAIGVVIGGILFIPALLGALLPSSWTKILKYLPSNAGDSFTQPNGISINALSPTKGGIVFLIWILLAIVGASYSLLKRDA